MPFKFDASGAIVLSGEGDKKLPVFVHADGREAPFDPDQALSTISRLNGESKTRREALEEAERRLKAFDGIDDGEAARKALETVRNLDAGQLIQAGKLEELKASAAEAAKRAVADATRAAEARQKQLETENSQLSSMLNSHILGAAFSGSKWIKEKLSIPPDMAQKFFGDRFKVDGNKLVPVGHDGNPIYSSVRHGEPAEFEEALQMMVAAYPNRDAIMRGTGASGGGTGPSGGAGGSKIVQRAQFDAMSQSQRAEFAKSGGKVVD